MSDMLSSVLIVAEVIDGEPTPLALEVATAARSLSDSVAAVVWGVGSEAAVAKLGEYGVNNVHQITDLGETLPGAPVAAAMSDLIAQHSPASVVVGMTYDGRDIAARLSARLDRAVITNAISIEVQGGELVVSNAALGGSTIVSSKFTCDAPGIVLLRAKSVEPNPIGGNATLHTMPAPSLGHVGDAAVVARHLEEREGPKLDEAPVVVSGGRGLGSKDNYGWVEELAKLLRGAPGATRAIVDAGWVPYAYQVGQTGKTVKPDVYIALGISGATQHLVGMKGAKHIIAINKDPDAPIFGVADLGIVGDVTQIAPKLIEQLRSR